DKLYAQTAFIPPEDDNDSLDKAEEFEIVLATTKKKTTPIHSSVHSPAHSPAHLYISNTQQEDSQQSAPTHYNSNILFSSQTIPQQNPSSEDAGHHDES
ncbi:17209_t:CDS:2, partial [Dentiscutata heterogama]